MMAKVRRLLASFTTGVDTTDHVTDRAANGVAPAQLGPDSRAELIYWLDREARINHGRGGRTRLTTLGRRGQRLRQ